MKPRWVCGNCGMWSSRHGNVLRHMNNFHVGMGQIVSFMDYVTGVHSGIYKHHTIEHSVYDRYSKQKNIHHLDPTDMENEIMKEAQNKIIQKEADKLVSTIYPNTVQTSISDNITLKASLFGYKASICNQCNSGYVQAILYYGSARIDYPPHSCSPEDLETTKHMESSKPKKGKWDEANELLFKAVDNWGKKQKLLASIPCKPTANSINLGVIHKGHWASGLEVPTMFGKILKPSELHRFLKIGHSTTGIFTLTSEEGGTVTKRLFVSAEHGNNPDSDSKSSSQIYESIFAYMGDVCKICCTAEVLECYYDGTQKRWTEHVCDPKRISDFVLLKNREEKIKELHNQLPQLLMRKMDNWVGKKNLYVQKVDGISENYIEVRSKNKDHWALRSIRTTTALDNQEVLEFLKKARATFGYFKIRIGRNWEYYYISISRDSAEFTN